MSGTEKLSNPTFNFSKNLALLNGNASVGFVVSGARRPDVLAALSSDSAPFPPGDVELADITLGANTPKPIEFVSANLRSNLHKIETRLGSFAVRQEKTETQIPATKS